MKRMTTVLAVVAVLMWVLAPAPVQAGVEGIVGTFTIPITDTGSTAPLTITMGNSNIRDVYVWCPTLDASDTATISLTYTAFSSLANATSASATVTPNGWADKVIGATADHGIVSVYSSAASIFVDGPVNLTVTCSTQQEAARVFWVLFIREY